MRNLDDLRVRATIYPTNRLNGRDSSGCFPLNEIHRNNKYIKLLVKKKW